MTLLKNKKILLIIAIIAIVLLSFFLFVNRKAPSTTGLTDQQKIDILSNNSGVSSESLPDTKKSQILNQTNSSNLSDKDKLQILNNI